MTWATSTDGKRQRLQSWEARRKRRRAEWGGDTPAWEVTLSGVDWVGFWDRNPRVPLRSSWRGAGRRQVRGEVLIL